MHVMLACCIHGWCTTILQGGWIPKKDQGYAAVVKDYTKKIRGILRKVKPPKIKGIHRKRKGNCGKDQEKSNLGDLGDLEDKKKITKKRRTPKRSKGDANGNCPLCIYSVSLSRHCP